MKNSSLERITKRAIVSGLLNSFAESRVQLEQLYNFLLNDVQLSKIKPFNMPRHVEKIADNSGIFQRWLAINAGNSEDEQNKRGKRVVRAVDRLAGEYNDMLPESIKGTNSLAIMLRVFFLYPNPFLTAGAELSASITYVIYLMRTILLLDMLFMDVELGGKPAEYWLNILISSACCGLSTVIHEIEAKGGF